MTAMGGRYRLNLARQPFRRYRVTNLVLLGILFLIIGFGAWQAAEFSGYTEQVRSLRGQEQATRVRWENLGSRIDEIRSRLGRPEAAAEIDEIRFLNEIFARKRFSWTLLLGQIEQTIPRAVYIVSLTPNVSDADIVRLEMEVRAEGVDALTDFLRNLEDSPSFQNVSVTIEEPAEVQGRMERRMLTQVDYLPSWSRRKAAAQ
jgi:Tfp pilus assembly protein PilN